MYPRPHFGTPFRARKKGHGCLYTCLGVVGTVVLLAIIIVVVAVSQLYSSLRGGTAPSRAGKHPSSHEERAHTGDTATDGKFAFTVTKVDVGVHHVGDASSGSTSRGQYILVHVTVENIGTVPQLFDASAQKLVDATGEHYGAARTATSRLSGSNAFFNEIDPGDTIRGIVAFDVPETVTAKAVELHDSPFSGGVTVSLAQ